MKVEFSIEESEAMLGRVIDSLSELGLKPADSATIRRWRSREMTPGKPALQLFTEKLNATLQRLHDDSEVSPIKKPDWL